MYTFYGWVVALIVLEVFVIQCDAVGNKSENASKHRDDDCVLPNEVLGKILHEAGLDETIGAGRSRALRGDARDAISRFFKTLILAINSRLTCNNSLETHVRNNHKKGNRYLEFGSYTILTELFETYGEFARRISIDYQSMNSSIVKKINKNIMSKYAKYFTELRMRVFDDSRIWKEMSNDEGVVQFPEVEKFTYVCFVEDTSRKLVDLNKMFPKLESLKLAGNISDPNCLKNVRNLKELRLNTLSELQLEDIFAKNTQISKLHITLKKKETLQSIEKLKKLETLKISLARKDCMTGGDRVYNFESVKTFVVRMCQLTGRLSFKMPNLRRLIVRGYLDQGLSDFINHFEKLGSVEIDSRDGINGTIECMKQLTHVKKYISPFHCSKLASLKQFFETFDKTRSSLKTLKLTCIDKLSDSDFKSFLKEINHYFKGSKKSTWTLTYHRVVENGKDKNYLMIERER